MKLYKLSFLISLLFLIGCAKEWQPSGSIILDGVSPIGLVIVDSQIWISDGDNNRVLVTDMDGTITKSYDSIERPMHMEVNNGSVLVPSYISDNILAINNDQIDTIIVESELDAPAAISMSSDRTAIADFYNNRVVLKSNEKWKSIGKKGRGELEFNYPTDVQIVGDKIYVADAYNNRIQVLDKDGSFIEFIGEDQKMNAATGIFVDLENVMITDFEHDRVLIFDLEGNLEQIIDEGLNKPTDIIVHNSLLYATNYSGKYISIYEYK